MILQIDIFENRDRKYSGEFEGPVELGRQDYGERGPFNRHFDGSRWRLIIASGAENAVGRHHALLEPVDGGKLKLTNGTRETPIRFQDRADLAGQASCELKLPVVAMLGTKTIRVQEVKTPSPELRTLQEQPRPPRGTAGVEGSLKLPTLLSNQHDGLEYKELVAWLHAVMDVLQAAADSNDFFERAARTVVDMVDLDTGRVIVYANGEWQTQAVQTARRLGGGQARDPSQRVLNKVLQEKRTVWEVPQAPGGAQVSLMGVEAVVAAPVMDRNGEVIGAIYGDRRAGVVPGLSAPISELEAMLVEMLARGVAAGLARVQQEKKALEARVQFEQFFTKDLAEQLARQPDWLEGRKTEVTVMFTDIRGFSRLTEKLDPEQAVKWTQAVLDMLSDCVLSEGGVLVDFTGDGLMALWGAPGEQPDHAERACRAALTILARLPVLNREWEGILGGAMGMGIGVNTGLATVGNVGSQYKFKYGARGNTVNVGSRVEGVTKQFKCQVLITRPTKDKLNDTFRTRRLGTVQVVNIKEPVEVHELVAPDHHAWPAMRDEYEKALECFENKEYSQVGGLLAPWRRLHPDDGPVLVLLYRAVRYMVEGTPIEHPVWVLDKK